MNTQTIFTIVGICPENVQDQIIKLKKELGIYKPDLPTTKGNIILKDIAHFAIKRSFWLAEGVSEADLLARLGNLIFHKCNISSHQFGEFTSSPYGAIIFAKINKSDELMGLHLNLQSQLEGLIVTKNPEHEKEGFEPHISLAYGIPKGKLELAEARVGAGVFPLEFKLDQIFLLKEVDRTKDEREILKIFRSI